MRLNKKSILFFILILIALHIAFFIYAFYSGNIYLTNDSKEYLNQATNLHFNHTWYAGDINEPLNDFYYSRRPPLTGVFIMGVKLVCNSDYAVCFAQCLLSILNLLIVLRCIRLFYPEWKNHQSILVLLLFFPTQMIYANMIMAETLFQTMLTVSFYFSLRFFQNKNTLDCFFLNFFLSLAVLVKPVMYLFFIPWFLFLIWLFIKRTIKLHTVLLALLFPLTVLLVSYRNYKLTKVFQYSSVHENHVTNYSVRNSIQFEKGKEFADSIISHVIKKAEAKSDYKEYHEYLMQENYQLLWKYKVAFVLLSVKGVFQFFLDPGRWDLYSFFYEIPVENPDGMYFYFKKNGIKGALDYLSHFPWALFLYMVVCVLINLFILLMFIAFLTDKTISLRVRLVAFLLVFYLAFVTGLMGSARYRMGVYPILLFAFPFGCHRFEKVMKKLIKKLLYKNSHN
jgi:dolichyl-phosphate-mannose-protein mannosyltransferase